MDDPQWCGGCDDWYTMVVWKEEGKKIERMMVCSFPQWAGHLKKICQINYIYSNEWNSGSQPPLEIKLQNDHKIEIEFSTG